MPIFLPAIPVVAGLIGKAAVKRLGPKLLQQIAKKAKNQKDFVNLARNKNKNLLAAEKTERATTATRKANQAASMKKTDAMLSNQRTRKVAGAAAGAGGVAAPLADLLYDDSKKSSNNKSNNKKPDINTTVTARKNSNIKPNLRPMPKAIGSYKIKKGDTLSKIAKDNNTTIAKLKELNNIKDVNKITAGKSLKIRKDKDKNPYATTKKKARGGAMKKGRGMGVALRGGGKVMK